MYKFSEIVLESVYYYRKILKKSLPLEQYYQKTEQLGIQRSKLRDLSDSALFYVAQAILQDLTNDKYSSQYHSKLYSGIKELREHLDETLKNYRIENGRVINISEEASHALVEAIQIISNAEKIGVNNTMKILISCLQKIIQGGAKEQINIVLRILNEAQKKNKEVFSSLLLLVNNYIKMY